jgi:putative ABC transport system permease protein
MKGCLDFLVGEPQSADLCADFAELFEVLRDNHHPIFAYLLIWKVFLVSLPPLIAFSIKWRTTMILSYVRLFFRNLISHKSYSFINISGLAVGMASCILILIWVNDELSWDRFHKHADRLFQVVEQVDQPNGIEYRTQTPLALGPALQAEIPEIEGYSRSIRFSILLEFGDKKFTNDTIDFADPAFFRMYSLPLLHGDQDHALDDKYSILLTEDAALKFFGDENPLGKTMRLGGRHLITVTGILKNLPHNSSWQFDCLMPATFWGELGAELDSWDDFYTSTHVLLRKNASVTAVNAKLTDLFLKHRPDSRTRLFLEPLTRRHLHDFEGGGDIRYIYIFSVLALIILVIACINFMNLTTARSAIRSREIGIRKVTGARQKNLLVQFMSESLFMSILAMGFAVVLVVIMLPVFNEVTSKELNISLLIDGYLFQILAGVGLFTGLLSGSYPALVLSSLPAIRTIKSSSRLNPTGLLFRRILVVTQFALSIFLTIGALMVFIQIDFMKTKDLGFAVDQVAFEMVPRDFRDDMRFEQLKQELEHHGSIRQVARTASLPGYIEPGTREVDWEGKAPDHQVLMNGFPVDYDTIECLGLTLSAGRSFSRRFQSEEGNFILNEAAVRAMNLEGRPPVGLPFSFRGTTGRIIGVVKDFHHYRVQDPIEPLVLSFKPGFILCIRFFPERLSEMTEFLKAKWSEVEPDYPFGLELLRDRYSEYYQSEERLSTLLVTATMLALFISCLGLLGLAAFSAERRTKEIGIRKVLGARVGSLVSMQTGEYLRWVLLANLFAAPASWLIMDEWLTGFAHRAPMSIWIFIGAGVAALVIALTTVGFISWKAAMSDPVVSLRYE